MCFTKEQIQAIKEFEEEKQNEEKEKPKLFFCYADDLI